MGRVLAVWGPDGRSVWALGLGRNRGGQLARARRIGPIDHLGLKVNRWRRG